MRPEGYSFLSPMKIIARPPLRKYFILVAFIISLSGVNNVFSQSDDDAIVTHVNHIEEFIERFNYGEGSAFQRYVQENYPYSNVDRKVVLRSLFNPENGLKDEMRTTEFIHAISRPGYELNLSFYDFSWYAVVPALLELDGIEYSAGITLEVQLNKDNSVEWAVVGVKSDLLSNYRAERDLFVSASSHAAGFPEVRKALSSSTKFMNIIATSSIGEFTKILDDASIENIAIQNDISFHFLQISGWIMIVRYIGSDQTDTINTGWLIDELYKIDSDTPENLKYRKNELGIY